MCYRSRFVVICVSAPASMRRDCNNMVRVKPIRRLLVFCFSFILFILVVRSKISLLGHGTGRRARVHDSAGTGTSGTGAVLSGKISPRLRSGQLSGDSWSVTELNSTSTQEIESGQQRESLLWRPRLSNMTKIILIRVPKTGSRTLADLVANQLRRKGLQYWDVPYSTGGLNRRDVIERFKGKGVFAAHMKYMDFQWAEPPVYISVIRDPIARITSNYYYSLYGDLENAEETMHFVRQNREEIARHTGNSTIPTLSECILREIPFCMEYNRLFTTLSYFCGEESRCRQPSIWAYSQAVKHIDACLAVGLSEEFADYLQVLERLMPSLFQGIEQVFSQPKSSAVQRTHTSRTKFKEPLSTEAEIKLRRMLEMEYRIFNYARDRFHLIKKELGVG